MLKNVDLEIKNSQCSSSQCSISPKVLKLYWVLLAKKIGNQIDFTHITLFKLLAQELKKCQFIPNMKPQKIIITNQN